MSLASGDLTTIATASAYMGNNPTSAVLTGLISRISRLILNELNRPFILPKDYNDSFSGAGSRQLVLPNWPVLSISNIYIDGGVATEASPLIINGTAVPFSSSTGWTYPSWNGVPPGDPAVIAMTAWPRFCFGISNIGISYRAGYQITNEAGIITEVPDTADPPGPSTYQITPERPYGNWASDEGVTYADGTPLVAVAASPAVGEYVPPNPALATPRNYYEFSIDDDGAIVLLSYGYVPADLEQAALELIADRYSYRQRFGIRSQMLASQETITYDTSGISSFVDSTLIGYKSVLPPALGVYV